MLSIFNGKCREIVLWERVKSAQKIKGKCWKERSATGREGKGEGGNEEAAVVVNLKDQ